MCRNGSIFDVFIGLEHAHVGSNAVGADGGLTIKTNQEEEAHENKGGDDSSSYSPSSTRSGRFHSFKSLESFRTVMSIRQGEGVSARDAGINRDAINAPLFI